MKNIYTIAVVFVVFPLLLSGCASQVATHDEATKSITDSELTKEVADKSWSAADSSGVVDDGWLKSFNDPHLMLLVDEAQKNNFGLKISEAKVEQSNALARQAGAALKPTVGLSGGYAAGSDELGDFYGGGLKVSWEADVWGRIRSATTGAEETAAASRSDYQYARQSLAAATANAWFLAVTSKILNNYANEVVALLTESYKIVEVKNKVGKGSMKDVHLAKADLAKAQEAARNALSSHENTKRSLELLLGRYPSAEVETIDTLVAVPPAVATGMPSQLLERRPDLIAAEQRVAAAFYREAEAELLHLPSFKFSLGLGANSLRDAASSLAAGLTAPLYTGGAIEAEVEKATAVQKQAIAFYGQSALTAFNEVEASLAAEEHLLTRKEYMKIVVEENLQAYQLTKKQYDIGQIEFLDVLIVQNKWIQARIASIEISLRRLLNRVGLHLALGGSFEMKPEPENN